MPRSRKRCYLYPDRNRWPAVLEDLLVTVVQAPVYCAQGIRQRDTPLIWIPHMEDDRRFQLCVLDVSNTVGAGMRNIHLLRYERPSECYANGDLRVFSIESPLITGLHGRVGIDNASVDSKAYLCGG